MCGRFAGSAKLVESGITGRDGDRSDPQLRQLTKVLPAGLTGLARQHFRSHPTGPSAYSRIRSEARARYQARCCSLHRDGHEAWTQQDQLRPKMQSTRGRLRRAR